MTRALAALAIIAAALTGYALGHADQPAPDITVMPCDAWANNARPEIPAYALTDACVDSTGTLHTAPTSLEKTR